MLRAGTPPDGDAGGGRGGAGESQLSPGEGGEVPLRGRRWGGSFI